ncbi:ABC transporter ATP-binding protein [Saccharibacillus brassicae]|uniref:ABC transporter ATP-binding protein n=1 Tax=Saccharibacillus brassicae TaxID=2583377 RepID=A0A4Y6UT03_SACBS|nr:ABC transporter ATP-binding protein [Saccharibacillus brassicae]QDH20789.1 ABC transporter ATP-binding protein [Saccharibacillus brassicae]
MEERLIDINAVSKIYKLYNQPMDRVREVLNPLKKKYHKDFYAVDNLTFNVKRGETVGIIGKNGSGKSTLLKMIAGVLSPSSGTIEVKGNVSALLELGAGFNGDLSGLENIYLNGTLLGYTKEYVDNSIPEILEFADIGDFIYQPVKTYSSGMFVRLAFAIAININPEILIVDEALSVGDMRFQQKCYRKIREVKKTGTVLFVSHDTGILASFCDRIIWMDEGKIFKEGRPDKILDEYQAFMSYDIKEMQAVTTYNGEYQVNSEVDSEVKSALSGIIRAQTFGNGDGFFETVRLINLETGAEANVVAGGDKVALDFKVKLKKKVDMPIFGFTLKDALGNSVIVTNTHFEKVELETLESNKSYHYQFKMEFPYLRNGKYSLDIALATGTYQAHEQIQWINDVLVIVVRDMRPYQEGRGYLVPKDINFEKIL